MSIDVVPTRRPRVAFTGFTLIELLVVIAIIALIVSILLPSLGKAREEAKAVKCQAGIRSILQMTTMYRQDQVGEKMWWYRIDGPDTFPAFPGIWTPWVFGGFQAPVPRNDGADSDAYPAQVRPLNKYMAPFAQGKDIVDAYICPSDRTWQTPIIGTGNLPPEDEEALGSWQSNGSSYTLNTRFMQGYTWPPGNFNFNDVTNDPNSPGRFYSPNLDLWAGTIAKTLYGGNAARFVMWVEQGCYASMYRAGPDLASSQSSPQRRGWHRKFSYWSAGFGDGHGEYRYIDTRVVNGNNVTFWDPKVPYGGLPR